MLLGATAVQDIALVVAAIVFARMTGPVWAEQFGLRPTRFWRAAGAVVATYIAFAILASLWGLLVGVPDDEPLLDDLGVDESTLLLVLGMLIVCVGAPLVEEFFFRGFFYRALRNRAGIAGAATQTVSIPSTSSTALSSTPRSSSSGSSSGVPTSRPQSEARIAKPM